MHTDCLCYTVQTGHLEQATQQLRLSDLAQQTLQAQSRVRRSPVTSDIQRCLSVRWRWNCAVVVLRRHGERHVQETASCAAWTTDFTGRRRRCHAQQPLSTARRWGVIQRRGRCSTRRISACVCVTETTSASDRQWCLLRHDFQGCSRAILPRAG